MLERHFQMVKSDCKFARRWALLNMFAEYTLLHEQACCKKTTSRNLNRRNRLTRFGQLVTETKLTALPANLYTR